MRVTPRRGPNLTVLTPAQHPEPNVSGLTINKVLAGAGASATSAVLGSFFGAAGTVTGAALGSMVITLATAVYNHSLDRTRDTVAARIKHSGGHSVEKRVEAAAPRGVPAGKTGPAVDFTTPEEPPGPVTRPKQRIAVLAAATVLLFALGMGVVTGIELIKGSTLTRGQNGTSIGQLIKGGGAPATKTEAPTTESPTTSSATSSPAATPSSEPTKSGASQPVPSHDPVVPNLKVTPAPVTLTPTTGPTPGPTKSGVPQPKPSTGPGPGLPSTGPG
jgi:hypothetical protein